MRGPRNQRRPGRGRGVAAVAVAGAIFTATPVIGQETVAIDRWLVSNAFPVDSAEDPTTNDYLGAPGEVAVLPDRGRTVAGADWTLVRRDSQAVLDLGDLRPAEGRVVVYAHTYLKSPDDRTIALTWSGLACTEVEAWLNGRSLTDLGRPDLGDVDGGAEPVHRALVRVGLGYNTFLLKAVAGPCRFGITASIASVPPAGLEGVRAQASRPYGDTRTGPQPWLIADRDAGPEPLLGWKDDELFGAAAVRLTAFAVTAIEEAKLKAKTGGEEVKRTIEWLTPADPQIVFMPIRFETLRRAVTGGEGMQAELDWHSGKSTTVLDLDPVKLLEAFRSSIRFLGWTETSASGEPVPFDGEDAGELADTTSGGQPHPLANLVPLPEAAGVTLVGEWKVPGWLSGFTLGLDVAGAPGEYRIGSLPVDGAHVVLCASCRKGETLQIVVRSGAAWTRFPGALIEDPPPPRVDARTEAGEWLLLLDEKGSREYRQRAAASQ